MPRNYTSPLGTRNYGNYNPEDLEKAVGLVQAGKLSQNEASKTFHIPRRTIGNRIRGKHLSKPGRPPVFSPVEENVFVSHIILMSDYGFPITSFDLRCIVKAYLDRSNRIEKRFSDNFPGEDWAILFLTRHKLLSQRMAINIKRCRAKVSPDTIRQYFENLSTSVEGVPAENIWNYDETNLTDDPGCKKVLTKRGCKYPERIMTSSKASTSVMFCGSAAGELLPPYIVYKAECLWYSWTENGPTGARYNRSKNGWFDQKIFEEWFEYVALPKLRRQDGKKVLIGDNLTSHLSAHVLSLCMKNYICSVALPPNSTHLTEPLDVAFFRPLKAQWRKILEEFKMQSDGTVPKCRFPSLLKELIAAVVLKENSLISGFRKCGIHPLDSDAVLKRIPRRISDSTFNESDDSSVLNVSDAVLSYLSEKRYGPAENQAESRPNKRSKINVPPGKGITPNDLNEDTNQENTNGLKKSKKSKTAQNKRRQRDTKFELEEGDSDHTDDVCALSDNEGEIIEAMETDENLPYDVGQFVIVDYEGEKFPGKVVNVDVDGSCEVPKRHVHAW